MFQLQFFLLHWLWRMGPRCSSAETQVCHRSYIIAANKNHAIPITFIQSTKCQISLKWQLPIEKRKIIKHVISVLSVLFNMYNSLFRGDVTSSNNESAIFRRWKSNVKWRMFHRLNDKGDNSLTEILGCPEKRIVV